MEQHEQTNNAGAPLASHGAHNTVFCLTEHNRLTPLADRRPKNNAMAKADDRTLKPVKQLRFNAEQMDADENKENFKRRGSLRKSLRGSRCLSAVVTEQERVAALGLAAGSPRMVQPGFVQSMCRFYADIRRSNTNVATAKDKDKDVAIKTSSAKKSSPLRICVPAEASPSGSDASSTSTSTSSPTSPTSPSAGRRSLSLFRSRSWSMRRKKNEERRSPSYSIKSHDSGFSDAAEAKRTAAANANLDPEDDEDPNLTQLPVAATSLEWGRASTEEPAKSPTWSTEPRAQFLSSPSLPSKSSTLPAASASSMSPSMALLKMEQSVGTVASLQEGLRLKSNMDEEREIGACGHRTAINTSNILSRSGAEAAALENKARKQFYLDEILSARTASSADVSVLSSNGGLVFSTPVRESFRKGSKNARLAAMAMARTSSLAHQDYKDKRRWSNMLTADEPSPLRRERPRTMVGSDAWDRFLDFKPNSQELSTQLLSPETETEEADFTSDVSMLPSLAVDGTATQLMVESFVQQQQDRGRRCQQIVFDPVNTLLMADADEDTIVEMDNSSTTTVHSQPSVLSSPCIGPVEEWWRDLHAWCEPECMTYLQSKPILTAHRHAHLPLEDTPTHDHEADHAVDVIKNIDADAAAIAQGIRDVHSLVVRGNLYPHMAKCVQSLSSLVSALVSESPSSAPSLTTASDPLDLPGLSSRRSPASVSVSPESLLQSRALLLAADRLRLLAHRAQMKASTATAVVSISAVNNCLQQMSEHLNVIVASRIKNQVRTVVSCLCSCDPRPALCALVRLGNSVCSSSAIDALVSEAVVSAAVHVANRALADQDEDLVVLALRAVSSICSNAKCIDQFQKSRGLSLLETVLCSGVVTEASLCRRVEAAGVLAQVTSPWIDNNHKINDIDTFVPNLVFALTGLCRSHVCEETFLLVAAALANLTFMASASVASAAMRKCHTARVLVDVVVDNEAVASLFAKDQVVTVLANLAAHAPCRQDMLSFPAPCDALSFLSRMLHTDMSVDAVGPAETAAAERVQKKAAIALSRLCHDVQVCFSLCALSKGALVRRLVTLCTQPDERNYSDAVLVACLAVLRRVRAAGALKQQQQLQQEVDRVLGGGRSIVDSFVELSTTRADFTGHNDATNMSSSRYESYV